MMVSLDEWNENDIKIKILLKGSSGTGKSHLCKQITGIMVRKGYSVLYLDGERGSEQELKNLKKEFIKEFGKDAKDVMKRIEYIQFANYKEMVEGIVNTLKKKGDQISLIIIDPMRLVEIARMTARDLYIAQGHAPSGWGEKDIKNKDTFDLSGSAYTLATTMVLKFLNDLINFRQDVICTLTMQETSKDEYKYKNEYDPVFDYVWETLATPMMGRVMFRAYPKKKRGAALADSMLTDDLLGEIVGIFKEKYRHQEEVQLEVKDIEAKDTQQDQKNDNDNKDEKIEEKVVV